MILRVLLLRLFAMIINSHRNVENPGKTGQIILNGANFKFLMFNPSNGLNPLHIKNIYLIT